MYNVYNFLNMINLLRLMNPTSKLWYRFMCFNQVNKLSKQCKLVVHECTHGLNGSWLPEILKHSTQEGSI